MENALSRLQLSCATGMVTVSVPRKKSIRTENTAHSVSALSGSLVVEILRRFRLCVNRALNVVANLAAAWAIRLRAFSTENLIAPPGSRGGFGEIRHEKLVLTLHLTCRIAVGQESL